MTEEDDLYHHSELEIAVLQNNIEQFCEMVDNTALDQRSDSGSTLLHKAAGAGHEEMVTELIDREIDLDVQNKGGKTALHLAIDEGHHDVAERIVLAGADPNIQDDSGTVPLFKLIYRGDVELAKLMVEYGADPHIESDGGMSPLEVAENIDAEEMVEVLSRYQN